jgi:hypothetical protein
MERLLKIGRDDRLQDKDGGHLYTVPTSSPYRLEVKVNRCNNANFKPRTYASAPIHLLAHQSNHALVIANKPSWWIWRLP